MCCIHSAENLAIVDCDPYVQVSVDDKVLGQTEAISRNHISPVWEEAFETPLLHNQCRLNMKVFSKDRNRLSDELMGVVCIDLLAVVLNETQRWKYPLEQAGEHIKAKGALTFSLHLFKNDAMIRIVKKPPEENEQTDLDKFVDEVLDSSEASDPVRETLKQLPIVTNPSFFNRGMVKDLLYDVRAATQLKASSTMSPILKEVLQPDEIPMNKLSLISRPVIGSTLINLVTAESIKVPPLADQGIRLILADSAPFLHLSSKYSVWVWARWLQVAMDLWRGKRSKSRLPKWADNDKLSHFLTISVPPSSFQCRCTLAMSRPFELRCEDSETQALKQTIDLRSLNGFIVSVDSAPALPYVLQVEVVSAQLSPDRNASAESTKSPQTPRGVGGGIGGFNVVAAVIAVVLCPSLLLLLLLLLQ
jgi:hypothetical protein